jgi:hypothetical protein
MIYPEYNIINFNKAAFVKQSLNIFDTEIYGWIDFGFGSGNVSITYDETAMKSKVKDDKIYMVATQIPPDDLYNNEISFFNNIVYITGSAFVTTKNSVLWFYDNVSLVIDSCLKNNLDEKGNLSLFNFLDSICKELNKALGGINTLEPIIDEEENTIRIIDQSYYEPKPRKYELELYGYNHDFKSSNFVRNFNLKTEITPDFANMAAISSTAGGYVKGVENTMFSKWNKGLNDRLQPEISAPLSTGFSNSRDEVKETYLKKFWWGHKSAFGLKNSPEIELDPQIIENNVSIVSEFYKSIQAEIQLNVDEKYASPTNGFVPINLGVTMDGIGGIKIYNELSVASRFLPPRYPENLHFIIRGVHHKLSNSDWETSVETTSIANSDNNGSHYIQYDKLLAEVKKILGETNEQVTGKTSTNKIVKSSRPGTTAETNTFYSSLLSQLGAPNTPGNVLFLKAWAQSEGSNAPGFRPTYNPFNTTLNLPGSTTFNSFKVINYSTMVMGVQASANTLSNSKYSAILNTLRKGIQSQSQAKQLAKQWEQPHGPLWVWVNGPNSLSASPLSGYVSAVLSGNVSGGTIHIPLL